MKRFCYYIDESMYEEGRGYRPVVVFESEHGYRQQGGGDTLPWYWGHDLETARRCAQKKNATLGLSGDDVNAIVASSMFPQHA